MRAFEYLNESAITLGYGGAPYKPGAVSDACFSVAPDGRFKGMKFKKQEMHAALKALADRGTLYVIAPGTASAGGKYSSYPMAPGSYSNSGRRGRPPGSTTRGGPVEGANGMPVVGGIIVPKQQVRWPRWPSAAAIADAKVASAAHLVHQAAAEAEALVKQASVGGGGAAAEDDPELALLKEESRRRGTREVKSRFVEVDGHTVLKANNYTLEEGESSVWTNEVEKSLPPPKKPMTAYMVFSKRWELKQRDKERGSGYWGEWGVRELVQSEPMRCFLPVRSSLGPDVTFFSPPPPTSSAHPSERQVPRRALPTAAEPGRGEEIEEAQGEREG